MPDLLRPAIGSRTRSSTGPEMQAYGAMHMPNPKLLYRRELPGGGFVDVREDQENAGQVHRAHVSVERRTDPARREGHQPPIVATAEGSSMLGVFRQLLEIASDNVAVARALLRWQADGKARF